MACSSCGTNTSSSINPMKKHPLEISSRSCITRWRTRKNPRCLESSSQPFWKSMRRISSRTRRSEPRDWSLNEWSSRGCSRVHAKGRSAFKGWETGTKGIEIGQPTWRESNPPERQLQQRWTFLKWLRWLNPTLLLMLLRNLRRNNCSRKTLKLLPKLQQKRVIRWIPKTPPKSTTKSIVFKSWKSTRRSVFKMRLLNSGNDDSPKWGKPRGHEERPEKGRRRCKTGLGEERSCQISNLTVKCNISISDFRTILGVRLRNSRAVSTRWTLGGRYLKRLTLIYPESSIA